MKWFDNIVVCAGAEAIDFVLPAIARRQNKNGIGLALLPRRAKEGEPLHVGQTQSKNGEVDRVLKREIQTFASVRGLLNGKTFGCESGSKRFAERRVIFDYE